MTIKNFKTITIAANTTTSIFSTPIFLPFIPSHFIIKFFCYNIVAAAAPTNSVVLLKTSLLNNESILSFVRSVSSARSTSNIELDLKYKMNPSTINGNYDFTMYSIDGSEPDAFTSMQFALTVEFIEEI